MDIAKLTEQLKKVEERAIQDRKEMDERLGYGEKAQRVTAVIGQVSLALAHNADISNDILNELEIFVRQSREAFAEFDAAAKEIV